MAGRIPLRIVTPEKVSWEGEVDSLVVPAHEGQLGVLPGHAPLLAQLVPGVLQIRSGEDVRLLAVSGGFVEIFGGRASVFAETAELAEEIDAERARQAAEKAKAALRGTRADEIDAQTMASLRKALIRLRVLELARQRPKRQP
jgi:F-type H+-transporting ATPase subunit epsilon